MIGSRLDADARMTYAAYDMSGRLNARLDPELAAKLRALSIATGRSTSDVVREAIELYHRRIVVEGDRAKRAFESTGFIGIASGDESLSSNYKRELTRSLEQKT